MKKDYYISAAYMRSMMQTDPSLSDELLNQFSGQLESQLTSGKVSGDLFNEIIETVQNKVPDSQTKYASQLGVAYHGPVGFASLSAPNLGRALEVIQAFSIIRTSALSSKLLVNNNRLELFVFAHTGQKNCDRWFTESFILAVQNVIETITAHPLGDQTNLQLDYSRPDNYEEVQKLFRTQCYYNAPHSSLSIPASWATIPSPLHDEGSFRSNLAKCRELKLQLQGSNTDARNRVSTRLLNHFELKLHDNAKHDLIPSLATLAEELHMSPRTLIRRLKQQQTSYKKILEQIRSDQAQTLLKTTHLTSAQISEKLGYQDPANFSRAFKATSGSTPTLWRKQN